MVELESFWSSGCFDGEDASAHGDDFCVIYFILGFVLHKQVGAYRLPTYYLRTMQRFAKGSLAKNCSELSPHYVIQPLWRRERTHSFLTSNKVLPVRLHRQVIHARDDHGGGSLTQATLYKDGVRTG